MWQTQGHMGSLGPLGQHFQHTRMVLKYSLEMHYAQATLFSSSSTPVGCVWLRLHLSWKINT
jgi:hypothetical protein